MSDVDGFRAVLHEWARRQLEERSGHIGPFEVVKVRLLYDQGYGGPDTPADDETVVIIEFQHAGGCPDWSRTGSPCPPVIRWSMPDTTSTVSMLNELLAI
jgi:hypothetical protein